MDQVHRAKRCGAGHALRARWSWASTAATAPATATPATLRLRAQHLLGGARHAAAQGDEPRARCSTGSSRASTRTRPGASWRSGARYGQSIIDAVRDDAKALEGAAGHARTSASWTSTSPACASWSCAWTRWSGTGPTCDAGRAARGHRLDLREKTKAMMDLIVLAFQCDLTRVTTFMLGNARSDAAYDVPRADRRAPRVLAPPAGPGQLRRAGDDRQLGGGAVRVPAPAHEGRAGGGRTLLDNCAGVLLQRDRGRQLARAHEHAHPARGPRRAARSLRAGTCATRATRSPTCTSPCCRPFGVPATTFGDDGTGPLPGLAGRAGAGARAPRGPPARSRSPARRGASAG